MGEENLKLGPGELYINGEPFADVLEATTEEETPETFVEDGEPCIPKTLLHEASFSCELSEESAKAFKSLAEAGKKFVQAFREVWENLERSLAPTAERLAEIFREYAENLTEIDAKKPPRVNKRPDYNQKAKDDTRGKIKRIRTQRSREKK